MNSNILISIIFPISSIISDSSGVNFSFVSPSSFFIFLNSSFINSNISDKEDCQLSIFSLISLSSSVLIDFPECYQRFGI